MSSQHQGTDRGVIEIVIVAALDERRVIGRGGELPWRLPADLRHFREVTTGHPVVMGRRTYEAIGRPLPQRTNIVLTTRSDYEAPGCEVASSVDEAIQLAQDHGADRVMIIGGESLYRQVLPETDLLVLTVVHDIFEGDTYFPTFDSEEWDVEQREYRPADEENPSAMSFVTLRAVVEKPRSVGEQAGPGRLPEVLQRNSPS